MRRHLDSVSLLAITSGILAVWLTAPSAALAQTNSPRYWNTASGTGVLWSTPANWWTTSTGTVSSSAPGSGNDAVFDGSSVNGSTIVQLSGSQAAAGLYFNNTGSTLLESSSSTPETLSIGVDGITVGFAAGPVTLGDPSNVNLMPISITGSQIWTNNDFAYALNVVSAISASVTSTVTFAGPGNTNISGAVSNGTGILALTMSGTGTVTLSGANSYTGVTTVSGGILQFNNELSLYNNTTASWTAANIVVNSGGTFAVNVGGSGQFSTSDVTALLTNLDGAVSSNGLEAGSAIGFDTTNASGGTFTIAGAIANTTGTGGGAVGVTKLGTNTLVLAGTNTYTGATTISAGTLSLTGSLTGSSVATSSAGVFSEGSTGVVAGAASFTQGSSGTSTLAGANSYTGATTISVGTLSLTGTIGGGASGTAISSAATFSESNTGVIAGLSSLSVTAGTTTLGGANTYTGATTISGGTLSLTGTIGGGASGTAISSAATFTESSTGVIAGTSSLTVTAGTTTLAGTNTYTGVTTISGGTLQFTNEVSLYNDTTASWTTANIIVKSGATLAFNVGGTSQFTSGDLATLLGLGTGSGGFESGSFVGLDTTNAAGGNFAYSAAIANPGGNTLGLTKLGPNTLTLSAANTYTGATTISAGTLSLTGTIGGGASGTAISSAATFTESSAGVIVGTSSLTVTAGTTTLAGANTYNGATTISGGTLNLTGSLTGSSVVTSSTGNFSEGSTGVVAGAVSFTQGSTGTSTLAGANTYTGNTSVNLGTLALTPATATPVINSVANSSQLMLGGGSLTMTGAAGVNAVQPFPSTTVTSGSSSISVIDGASGGNFDVTLGAITRPASGGTVSFTLPAGAQTLTNGIVTTTPNASAAIGILGGYATVGGNWAVSGNGGTAGNITALALSSYTALPSTVSASTTTNDILAAGQTQTGVVSANSLNITDTTPGDTLALGANTLTFNGANGGLLYSGGSSYSITGTGAIGSGSTSEFIVTTTGSGNLTISAPLTGTSTGSVTKAGTGTLTVAVANTYTGATTIAGGTLALVNPSNLGSASQLLSKAAISVASGATFAPQAGLGIINIGTTVGSTHNATLTLNSGSIYNMVDGQIGLVDFRAGSSGLTSLTFNGATLNFDIGAAGTDLLETNQLASINGINTINLTPIGGILPVSGGVQFYSNVGGSFFLVESNGFTGTGTFQFSNGQQTENMTVGGTTYTLALSKVAAGAVNLLTNATAETVTVTSQAPTLTWTGAALNPSGVGNGTPTLWDIGTTVNWSTSPTSNVPATYSDGNAVVFGDFPGTGGNQYVNYRYITIQPAGVTPSAVSFTGSTANYQIDAGSGPIMGATTTLTSNSAYGNVILNSNTYGGGTWIAAGGQLGMATGGLTILTSTTTSTSGPMGTVVITSGPLGTGTINFVGGGLGNYSINNNPDSITLANNIVISANATVGTTGGGTMTFDGTNLTVPATVALANTPLLSFGGTVVINDVVTGNSGLTVTGSGQLVLNGANTYTGITTIIYVGNSNPNPLLSVSNLGLGGSPSGIGESSNAAANLVINDSTLQYQGSGGTTDRLFTIAGNTTHNSPTLDASGTGPIVWSNPGAIVGSATGPLTLTGTNTGANTLTPILTGANALTKSEAGTWVLAGSNTFTGGTTINGGILAVTGNGQVYAGTTTGNSAITVGEITVNSVTTYGTLEVDRWDVGTGLGSFGKLPGTAASLTINGGTIMYTGSTNSTSDTRGFTIGALGATLNSATAGTWNIDVPGTNTISSSSNGLLTLTGTGTGVLGEAIPGGGGLAMSGTGTWTLTGANSYTGATTLSSGTLVMGSTTALSTSAVTLGTANNLLQFTAGLGSASLGSLTSSSTGGGNIVLQDNAGSPPAASGAPIALSVGTNTTNNGTMTYYGSLSGSGSLAMVGTGVFTLNAASTYTGATSVTKGTLQLASTASLGNTAISVASGATFAPLAGSGSMSGTIIAGSNGSGTAGASLNLPSGAIFSMVNPAGTSLEQNIGTFQLQQESSFSPTTPTLTLGGATLTFGLNGSVGALEIPAVDLLAAGGKASVTGTNTINLTLISSVLTPTPTGEPIPLITAASGLTGTFQLASGSANMTVNGIPYALTLNNTPTAETLTIVSTASTVTWTGQTNGTGTVNSTWDVNMSTNWANSSNSAVAYGTGDTAVFNDTNAVTGLQVTNGTINITPGGVTPTAVIFNNSIVNYTISEASGPIVGAATLSKSGSALLSIQDQNNTYSRGTTLSAGTLQVTLGTLPSGGSSIASGPVGTGTLSLSGGTFDNGSASTVTLANSVAITANSTLSSSGTGPLVLDGTSLTTPATVVLSNSPTLTVNNTTTINDVISGSGQSLTLAGSGTLILGGASSYPGTTTINSSATLQLGNGGSVAGSITDNSALVFATTTGSPSYATAISGSGSVTVNGTGSGTLTLSGGNSFQGGLTILGNGILTLSGANTYSGGTLIQSGTLRAGAVNTLPTTGAVTFGGSGSATGTLDLNGYGLTVGGLIIASGASTNAANQIITNSNTSGHGSTATLTYNGTSPTSFAGTLKNGTGGNLLALTVAGGNLTLNGANTYTGATAVNGGTLQVSAPGSLASAVTVNSPATLSGSGTISGLVTVNSGGILAPSGIASAATSTTLTGGLTLTNGAVLDFNLTTPGSGDSVTVSGGSLSLGTTGGVLNINEFGGGGELEATSYPLIFDSSITGNAANWTVHDHAGDTGHTYSFTDTGGQFDLVVGVAGTSGTWISSGSGSGSMDYGTGGNWDSTQVPNSAGISATFGTGSQMTVSVNGAYTVGQLNFNNSISGASYYLTGSGSLTLNNSGSGASVNVSSGSLSPSILTTLTLADSSLTTTFNVATDGSLDLAGTINESTPTGQKIVLTGGGIVTMDNGANSYTGGTTVNGGTTVIVDSPSGDSTLGSGPLAINGASSNVTITASALTVGSLSGTGAGQLNVSGSTTLTVNETTSSTFSGTLTLDGALVLAGTSGNTLTISGAPTLNDGSSISVNSGTLAFTNSTSATINGSPTVSVASGATLQLAGSAAALSSAVNITTHGSGSASDGALTLVGNTTQTVGIVSGDTLSGSVTAYSGNTTVGDGTNVANLTATQILQNTLTINAGSTVTIAPSGSGIETDAQGSAVVSGVALAAGSSDSSSDSSSDPFTAIQAAIASGSISSVKGQQLENRIAAIERLAATDPGLDVSLLENRVLAAIPSSSIWSSTSSAPLAETGSGLLAVDSSTSVSAAFAPGADFAGSPAAVPEPTSLLLATLAGIGILVTVRRRTIYCE